MVEGPTVDPVLRSGHRSLNPEPFMLSSTLLPCSVPRVTGGCRDVKIDANVSHYFSIQSNFQCVRMEGTIFVNICYKKAICSLS